MVEKFDYIILNEDNEWLSTGHQQTQEQFEEELAIIHRVINTGVDRHIKSKVIINEIF